MALEQTDAVTEAPPRPALSKARAAFLLAVLLVFYTFAVMDRAVISMVVDPIRSHLHITDTQVALLMGFAYAAGYAGAALPMGYLADKMPRKWLLYAAVTIWGCAEAACGLATGFMPLFMARVAVGVAEAPLHPSAHSLIADTFPKRRLATAMSIFSAGSLIGTGVALSLGGWIVHALSRFDTIDMPMLGALRPWQLVFIITGLPGLALAFLIVPFREPLRRLGAAGPSAGSWREFRGFVIRRWRVLLGLTVAFGGMNIVNGAMLKWEPAYLSRFFHLNPAQYGLSLGLIYVFAGLAGMLFSGSVVDRLFARGHRTAHVDYYLWALIGSAPIVFYGLLSSNLWVYLASVVLAKFATINFLGFLAALIQIITPPPLRGRMSSIFFLMVLALLGSSLGPLIAALISDYVLHDAIRMGRSIAATLAIFAPLAVLAMLWVRAPLRRVIDEVAH